MGQARLLYIHTVICFVFRLRSFGNWLGNSQVVDSQPVAGILDFRRVAKDQRERFGDHAMIARLLSLHTQKEGCLPTLHRARVVQIKEGGVMIEGFEFQIKGVKSAPIETRQTWWCVVNQEAGFAALQRMRAPGYKAGFHPDDDDLNY